MKSLVIDFESYWDSDYTLKKLSTSEYIADERFEALSCSIFDFMMPPRFCRAHEIRAALASIDWSNTIMVGHHNQFDSLLLTHHFGYQPARYACTLAMARAWEQGACEGYSLEELAAYHGMQGKIGSPPKGKRATDLTEDEWCALKVYNDHDVKLTAYFYSYYAGLLPASELELQHLTLRMFAEPALMLDKHLLLDAHDEAKTKKDDVLAGLDIKAIRSRTKFPELLRACGVEPPTKISKTTGKETYAFSKKDLEFTELLTHHDERVRTLVEAKLEAGSNLAVTRPQRLLLTRDQYDLRLPVYLKSSAARTHRWGGGDLRNWQNFTRGSKLRKGVIAPPGHVIVAADQAQVEARFTGYVAGADRLVSAFAAGRDVYAEFATEAYRRPINKKNNPLERFVGKTCVLGLGFGTSAPKLQHSLATDAHSPTRLELEECGRLVNTYRIDMYPEVPAVWRWLDDVAIPWMCHGTGDLWLAGCVRFEGGKRRVWLPNGTSLHYPHLDDGERTYVSTGDVIKLYGAKLFENIIQALARVKISEDMLAIDHPTDCRIVGMTHDEIACVVPVALVDEQIARITTIMSASPPWAPSLPLSVEVETGHRYPK